MEFSFENCLQAQTFQSKSGGICFRFDDYQTADKLRAVNALFNKYGFKFTYALNTGIPDLLKDTTFWNAAKELENAGHELADQSPSDAIHYFEPNTAAIALSYNGRAGVDHITTGSPNRVCLKYSILNNAGAGDEGNIDISGNRIISKNNGEFAWTKLNNGKVATHLYFPSLGKLVQIGNILNANANNPDTIFVNTIWNEPIALGTYSNIAYRKISPYQLSIDKEGLQLMAEFSMEQFEKYKLKLPKTFIHPGGAHPYVDKQVLKEALEPFGIKCAASYPEQNTGISYYNPHNNLQYCIQGSDISPETQSAAVIKTSIAEAVAKNQILISINHFSSAYGASPFSQMLSNLEQVLIWCKANTIPVKTYQDWSNYLWGGFWDQSEDIFPALQTDLDKNGTADGLTFGTTIIKDTVSGVLYNKNYCLQANSSGTLVSCDRLFGLNRGKNTFYVSTKGGANANDYLTLVVNLPEINASRYYAIPCNSSNFTERSVDIEIPDGINYVSFILNYVSSSNAKIYVSGIKFKSAKKPFLKGKKISRVANQAFTQIDLAQDGACSGYAQTQMQYYILTNGQNIAASLTANRYLNLVPKNNRFWIGLDSIKLAIKAPDNTADTDWIYINSIPCKICKEQTLLLSINKDTLVDATYTWGSKPIDPFLQSTTTNSILVKPSQKTSYFNTLTFKNTSKRTDSILVDLIPSNIITGPFELKRFNGANSVSFTLNYPSYYKIELYQIPVAGETISTNGSNITITRNAGFVGNMEAKLLISTPACKSIIHTLVATTYAVGERELAMEINSPTIYPNPFGQFFSIESTSLKNAKLEVYNLMGAQVFAGMLTDGKNVISAENWLPGIYLVQLITDKQVYQTKVVKE